MASLPRITIVTPSYNQAKYISETIESVIAQAYPNLEHIVIDGGSTDGTLEILNRYPDLIVISESDKGQADAINKGFKLATGEILGYLCSDDTLLLGTLDRIVLEIDPDRGRHIVMGRCSYRDANGRFVGIEHPSNFESHKRLLEIWKGHTIPQPSVFWTRGAWENCGPMDSDLGSDWIDYSLFCRFSKRYHFWFVDQILATYRLHPDSKTQSSTDEQRLAECIKISRSYWGSPMMPLYWQLTWSLMMHNINRTGRARKWLQYGRDDWVHRKFARSAGYLIIGSLLAPEVAFFMGIYPFLRMHARGILHKILNRLAKKQQFHPQTQAYWDYLKPWTDGWVGPHMIISCEAKGYEKHLTIEGIAELLYLDKPLVLSIIMNDQMIKELKIEASGNFRLTISLPSSLSSGIQIVEIKSNAWFIPDNFNHGGDYRPLAWRFLNVSLI